VFAFLCVDFFSHSKYLGQSAVPGLS
jgi:hypothetical protein